MSDLALNQELEMNGYLPLVKFVAYLKEFAPQASVSYPTALKYVKEGKLRALTIGTQHRITRLEIERWIAGGNFDGNKAPELPKHTPLI